MDIHIVYKQKRLAKMPVFNQLDVLYFIPKFDKRACFVTIRKTTQRVV